MTEKKLRELEALMATKDILSPKEVGELWDLEIAARSKYLKEYKDEIARLDSKLPGYGLIYHSRKAQWVGRDTFKFFMCKRTELADEVRRKAVSKYRKGWENEELG